MNRRAIAAFLLGLPACVGACNAVLSNDPVSLWDPDASVDGGGVTPDAGGPDATLPGVDSGLATDSGASDAADGGIIGDSAGDANTACGDGACLSCPAGFADCNGTCVDVASDNANCGACGNACLTSAGQSCVAAACTPGATLFIGYNGYALDDPAGGGAGTGLDQLVYVGPNPNQEWLVILVTAGQYKIVAANGLALTGSSTSCGQVSLQSYTGNSDQLWELLDNGSYVNVVNVASGWELDENDMPGQGETVINCPTGDGTNEEWTLLDATSVGPPILDGPYAILDRSGFALDDPGGSPTATIDQEPYGSQNQQWTISRVSGIQYKILSPSGLALAGSPGLCDHVALDTYTGAASQLWVFQPYGSEYNVLNVQTGLALDENDGGGQGVSVLSCDFSSPNVSQTWDLYAAVPAGSYTITDPFFGFALDDPADGGDGGSVPDQVTYSGANQQWALASITGLQYSIVSPSGGALTSGTQSTTISPLSGYTGESNQLWTFSPEPGGYNLRNVGTGLYLDSHNSGPGNSCNEWTWILGSWNQTWTLTPVASVAPPVPNGVYSFVNGARLTLDDPDGGGAGTTPDQAAYAGSNQNWTVTLVSNYEYKIMSAGGYALGSGTNQGEIVPLASYTGATSQLWSFAPIGGGSYFVVNVGSNLLLDDNNGGAGTPCNQWGWGGGGNPNQVWTLVEE